MFSKLLNDITVGVREKGSRFSEGQAGFGRGRGWTDDVYTAGRITQSKKEGGAENVLFFSRRLVGM